MYEDVVNDICKKTRLLDPEHRFLITLARHVSRPTLLEAACRAGAPVELVKQTLCDRGHIEITTVMAMVEHDRNDLMGLMTSVDVHRAIEWVNGVSANPDLRVKEAEGARQFLRWNFFSD